MEERLLAALSEKTGTEFLSLRDAMEEFSGNEIFGFWLEYEGIIGYTDAILTAVYTIAAQTELEIN